ncbi:MAG: cytochrome c-type biogenesis protein [Cellvibrionaceae bacterium]|jgi:cytochrome c-type biogenesis protein
MQETVDPSNLKKDDNSIWTGRNLGIAVVGLIAILIIFGIINDMGAEASPFAPQQSFGVLAVLAFLGGLLSFLSPCTLPILPAYFAFAAKSSRSQIALNTMIFMLGVATVFSFFGASASTLGSLLRNNQGLILLIGGILIVVFGTMSLIGQGFTGMSAESAGTNENMTAGGSFIFGVTFAAGWSSCIGPILGIMLTMAATTASVARGTILLFIFAMGLGLPLIIVSTFIGRASRQSFIWRVLRGKGWFLNVPAIAVSAIWGIAIWMVLYGIARYTNINFSSTPISELSSVAIFGLGAIAMIGAVLYNYTLGQGNNKVDLHLHSTSIFSGVLFLAMGYFMLNGRLSQITAWFNQLTANSDWFTVLEEGLFGLFQ